MNNFAAIATTMTAAGLIGGCAAPADTAAPPPSTNEQHALADATAMIPPGEHDAAPEVAGTGEAAAQTTARGPKSAYRTPLPGQTRAK